MDLNTIIHETILDQQDHVPDVTNRTTINKQLKLKLNQLRIILPKEPLDTTLEHANKQRSIAAPAKKQKRTYQTYENRPKYRCNLCPNKRPTGKQNIHIHGQRVHEQEYKSYKLDNTKTFWTQIV